MSTRLPQKNRIPVPVPTRKGALLWCLSAGFLGAHRFYLGQKSLGFLYLVFFWTLIPLFASLIDATELALQDDEDFKEERLDTPRLVPARS